MNNIDEKAKDVIKNIVDMQGGIAGGSEGGEENPPEHPEKWDETKVYAYKSKDNIVVPVPNGFTVSEIDREQSVNTGLVIKITQEGVTSEFVWVPVANTSEMFGVDKDGNNLGKLYKFTKYGEETVVTAYNWTETSEIMKVTDGGLAYEPAIAPTDSTESYYTDAGIKDKDGNPITTSVQFKTQLQEEFNTMKESIEKYNGFYIGRYETGNLSKTRAAVTKNNSDIGSQTWYVMYQKSKEIVEGKSSMIWGCQWDAVMKWFLSDDGTKEYVTNSIVKGNYSGSQIPTGSNDNYSVKNIYDMAGNEEEWTLTSFPNTGRALRRTRF